MSRGIAAVCEEAFVAAIAFPEPRLRARLVSQDESLIKRVPVAGDRAGKRH
jgi:hypothetical protein